VNLKNFAIGFGLMVAISSGTFGSLQYLDRSFASIEGLIALEDRVTCNELFRQYRDIKQKISMLEVAAKADQVDQRIVHALDVAIKEQGFLNDSIRFNCMGRR